MKKCEHSSSYLLVVSVSATNPFSAREEDFGTAFGEHTDIFADRDKTDREMSSECSDPDTSPMCKPGNRFFSLA